jgi:RimJ/RimL family protein N-acetyltransferase
MSVLVGEPVETYAGREAPRELETERLLLRQWRADDFEPIAAFCADEASMRYVGGVCDRHAAWRKFAVFPGHWALRGFGFWAVEEKATGRLVGPIGLYYPDGWPGLEIGYWAMATARGKGFVTEAARAAKRIAFERLQAKTLISCILPGNAASQRVAARLGARYQRTIDLRGEPCDIFLHAPDDGGTTAPAAGVAAPVTEAAS